MTRGSETPGARFDERSKGNRALRGRKSSAISSKETDIARLTRERDEAVE